MNCNSKFGQTKTIVFIFILHDGVEARCIMGRVKTCFSKTRMETGAQCIMGQVKTRLSKLRMQTGALDIMGYQG